MSATPIPEARRAITPYLIIKGVDRAIDFYKVSFAAIELVRLTDTSGKIQHTELLIGSPPSLGSSPVSLLLDVTDVGAFFAKATAGSATETMAADTFDGIAGEL